MFKLYKLCLILTSLWLGLTWPAAAAPPAQGPLNLSKQQLIDRLKQNTQNKIRIAYHTGTGKVNFIGTDLTHLIALPGLLPANADREAVARGFLAQYGSLFGLKDPAGELDLLKQKTLADGRAFVRFQQRYQGVPIIGGELIVQTDARQNIISANGEILPDLNLDPVPTLSVAAARQTALIAVAQNYHLTVDQLSAAEPELWIYNPVLLGNPAQPGSVLVWRTEVTSVELRAIREFVLIDAHTGGVVLNFNQVDTALDRQTYNAGHGNGLPGSLICNEANPTCSGGDTHAVAAHQYAGDTYNFYFNTHGRDSIDNAGLTLVSTVHYSTNYNNAFWDGSQMVYGDFFGFPLADDVVGHELTHGVTQYESGLIYFFESGAINESLSDVWGEFVDQTNSAGDDSVGVRWLMGEDVLGLGAIRNMQNPPAFGQPDKMSSLFYYHGFNDNGGVHTNSGVNNKAAYLMTDGGTFNGKTVTALGITKVAKIYYEAQTNLLTSAANYIDLYNVLDQACTNLIGQAGISSGDCQSVHNATLAVEMGFDLSIGTNIFLPIVLKDVTSGGGLANGNFESGATRWNQFSLQGFGLILPAANLPVTPHSGNWAVWLGGATNEIAFIEQQVIVPAGSSYLVYWHWVASQDNCGFDFGAVIINSTVVNTYDLCSAQNTNGWVKHVVNLAAYAGQSVSLQIRGETDSLLNSNLFIDDVSFQSTPTVLATTAPTSPARQDEGVISKADKVSPTKTVEKTEAEFLLRPEGWVPKGE